MKVLEAMDAEEGFFDCATRSSGLAGTKKRPPATSPGMKYL
jgi:hypothetical protein